jgi:hypothetical protein
MFVHFPTRAASARHHKEKEIEAPEATPKASMSSSWFVQRMITYPQFMVLKYDEKTMKHDDL